MRTVSLPSLASPPPPVVSEGEHVPFPEHISCFGPHYFPTLAHAHARSTPHFHTHAMPPSIVHRMERGHVLLSDGWVARAPAPISAPCDPPRHSLRYNGLSDEAEQAVRDAAGSGVSITF